jgi:hypothetical protein
MKCLVFLVVSLIWLTIFFNPGLSLAHVLSMAHTICNSGSVLRSQFATSKTRRVGGCLRKYDEEKRSYEVATCDLKSWTPIAIPLSSCRQIL